MPENVSTVTQLRTKLQCLRTDMQG